MDWEAGREMDQVKAFGSTSDRRTGMRETGGEGDRGRRAPGVSEKPHVAF